MKGPIEIGLVRRVAVMLLGLGLWGNRFANPVVHATIGLLGVPIFFAGIGVLELAVALW